MTLLDRTLTPPFQKIDSYVLPEAETTALDNGIPYHQILSGTQPVIRLELIFKASTWNEPKPGVAHFTTKMLTEGTLTYSAKEIQERFAFYGAFIEATAGMNKITLTLYTLSKHLEALLPLVYELIAEAKFPESELENSINITVQSLKVNLEKSSFLAGNKFKEMLFGPSHPYGHFLTEAEMLSISSNTLQEFYKKNFTPKNCEIIISGGGDQDFKNILNNYFGQSNWGKPDTLPNQREDFPPSPFTKRIVTQKDGAIQSSIRMGKKMFTNAHPDYFNMYFLNELFGGYFGSRLMQNIREDKGYTYGINSSIVTFQNEGYLVIGTDVKKDVTEQTIEEVYKEMKRLKEEKVGEVEMESVRNYILGSFVNSISNPFAIADKFKTVRFNGLDYSFYKNYFKAIQTINSDTILTTANKYFDENSIIESIAGDCN